MSEEILVVRCGTVPYDEAVAAQRRLERARQAEEVPDLLLLLEHDPVYTRGRRSTAAELPMGVEWYEAQGIAVRETDRGGRLTYHGPGQLVAYPIVSLKPYGDDVHEYVRRLERVAISALAEHGVAVGTIEGLTGVWTKGLPENPRARLAAADTARAGVLSRPNSARLFGLPASLSRLVRRSPAAHAGSQADPLGERPGSAAGPGEARKIGQIGIHVSRGVTTHGMAVNVNNDLQPFEWVVPCGIEGCGVTSLSRELGAEQDLDAFAATVARRYGELFGREPVDAAPGTLGIEGARLGVA